MVTMIKRCLRHGIVLGADDDGTLRSAFAAAFPAATWDEAEGEWVIPWAKGTYAESAEVLKQFFRSRGKEISFIDRC